MIKKDGDNMLNWLIGVFVNTVLLIAIDGYFDSIHFSGVGAAFIASMILAILNAVVRPILILLTLPVTILTMGLFLFVINAITLKLTAALMGSAFEINGFGSALLASIVLSFFHLLIQKAIIEPLRQQ
jgi:putative membrane protein